MAVLLVGLIVTQASACDDPFPVPSRLESVRVLGAVMDKPLSHPGETVDVQLLVHDGGAPLDAPRPLRIAWFGGCHNPADDAPGNCYERLGWLADLSADDLRGSSNVPAAVPPAASLAFGATTTVRVPDDLVRNHVPIGGETEPRGLSFLFFAVCQGSLVPFRGERSPVGIPVDCVDDVTGRSVGASRFVSGYVTVRAALEARNQNPALQGVRVDGRTPSHASCDASSPCGEGETCGDTGRCLPTVAPCTKGAVEDCPRIRVTPVIDERSYELDETAGLVPAPPEALWIAYFTSAGQLDGDARMVVDPSSGRASASDVDGQWQIQPGFHGEARVFVVAHDNRGGAAYLSEDVWVR
jgi:hypothetical protein